MHTLLILAYFTQRQEWTPPCPIHDPRTCPFSADDGAYAKHRKGPRPVSCEINSRFRRFGPRTVHPAPLGRALAPTRRSVCSGGSAIPQPHDLVDTGLIPEPATSSARIITMDHDAIICFMTDRLTRATDTDYHGPGVGSIKVPFSWCRCHILVVDYRWGRMWSNEGANTIPTTPCATRSAPRASAVPRPHYLVDTGPNTWTREYQRRHRPDGP